MLPKKHFIAGIFAFLFAALFVLTPLFRHWSYGSFGFDLGIFENILYNAAFHSQLSTYAIAHGNAPLAFVPDNDLAFGLVAIALVYRIFPSTETLLLLQSLALLSALFPAYLLGKKILPPFSARPFAALPQSALLPCVFLVLWEPWYRLNTWDFHPAAFVLPFFLFAALAFEQRKYSHCLLLLVLSALWRTDVWWMVSAFCLMGFLRIRSRARFAFLGGFVIAACVFPAHYYFWNQVNDFDQFFSYLGSTPAEAWQRFVQKPTLPLWALWGSRSFLAEFVIHSGLAVFCLSGVAALPILPMLTLIALSDSGLMQHWGTQYVATLTGPILYANVLGWNMLLRHRSRPATLLVFLSLLSTACSLGYFLPQDAWRHYVRWQNSSCLSTFEERVPKQAALLVDNELASHFARRHWFSLPYPILSEAMLAAETQLHSQEKQMLRLLLRRKPDQSAAEYLLVNIRYRNLLPIIGMSSTEPAHWEVLHEECSYLFAKKLNSSSLPAPEPTP